jgi:CheY-like chemotaxis protein
MRVLIVDDSRTARVMLRRMLPAQLLTDLVEVSSGQEAMTLCRSEAVDLMFLDLTMPDCTGYEVLRALQAAGRAPPTVVISADSQPLARARVHELGALAFLTKPPGRADLERVLRDARVLP